MKSMIKLGIFSFAVFGILLLCGAEPTFAQRSGTLEWRGTVDDRVNLVIRGRNVRVVTLSGQRYGNGNSDFDNGYDSDRGRRQYGRARVDKRDGRGRVDIIQQPNRRNNYTTIVQIYDSKGGADRYRVYVEWE